MTPTLNGQDIGRAHHATRAALEKLLSRTGLGFTPWVAVNLLGSNGSPLPEPEILAQLGLGLKIDEGTATRTLAELLAHGTIEPLPDGETPVIALTPSGQACFDQVTAELRQLTELLYGDLSPDDLAIAHRVLATVTDRANAVLAG